MRLKTLWILLLNTYKQEEVMAYRISDCVKFRKFEDSLGLGYKKAETKRIKKLKELV